MKQGAFTFVLHSHIPYCRQAGRWPHGEEWIHEALLETYLPLLDALWSLRDEGINFKSTIGLTPVLADQLRDSLINTHFVEYTERNLAAAEADLVRHRGAGAGHLADLAQFYVRLYQEALTNYRDRYRSDVVGAFGSLQETGHIEIATSGATHGYLPLMDRDSTIAAQIGVGVDAYTRMFGRPPRAFWLPECAYRPAKTVTSGGVSHERPGLEHFLAERGIRVFFSETHAVEGGLPVGKAAGDAIGPYGSLSRRYQVTADNNNAPTHRTTFEPYWVGESDVAIIARNNRTGLQVWSAEHGYPGDFNYREFHKRDGDSGMRYWKITGRQTDLADKEEYWPEEARNRARDHARHFASLIDELVSGYHAENGRYGIVSAAYDTELFGHWWFEGIDWIREVLRILADSPIVDLTTASGFVEAHPPAQALQVPETSWGQGGGHFTWLNVDTEWIWPIIHRAERRMELLVETHPNASGVTYDVLRQAGRELLLLQSSDWPFLISTGQAREYAIMRFQQHVERFDQLAGALEAGPLGPNARALAADLFERDRVFEEIDEKLFTSREPAGVATVAPRP
jgi:1,4-alpha-glucan branching enzyme